MISRMSGTPRRSCSLTLVAAALALAAAGCREPADSRPVVAVSVPPQAYFAERLAGDLVDVLVMIPPAANPVHHAPTVAQRRALARARLYFAIGHPAFPFERTWLRRTLDGNDRVEVVDVFAGVERRPGDPHLWLSPTAARRMAERMAAALAELLPAHRATVEANLATVAAEIDAVERDLVAVLGDARGKRFFVFHPAWGYFAAAYGLEQVAVERDGKEPDARTLAELIRTARAAGVDTLFVEPQFDRASAEVVAGEVGAELAVADPLAYDWGDNLRRFAARVAAAAR